jgi:hypothetical protein
MVRLVEGRGWIVALAFPGPTSIGQSSGVWSDSLTFTLSLSSATALLCLLMAWVLTVLEKHD